MDTTLVVVACAVMGLVIGSFLTVVVDRVPNGGSVIAPPSACGSCGNRLTALDLVPIASWLALRGRCRHCGTTIGYESIVVELATASLFVLMGLRFGADPAVVPFCVMSAGLVALTWIDLEEYWLPREIIHPTIAVSAPLLVIAALWNGEPERIWQAALGAGIALALMGMIYLASRGGMGDGDVRLSPLLGMHLGYLNPGIVPFGLFLGFVLGAVVGVVQMTRGEAGRKTPLPFGPFLAAGTVLAVFVGQDLVDLVWHA